MSLNTGKAINSKYVPSTYRSFTVGSTPETIVTNRFIISGWNFINNTAGAIFVKLYNKAAPNPASDTPFLVLMVPANGTAYELSYSDPLFVENQTLSIRCVTGLADTDTTSPTGDYLITVLYR